MENPIISQPKFKFNENFNYAISKSIVETHNNAKWKSRNLGVIHIRVMTDEHLQKAFEDVQYAELKLLKEIEKINKTKEHLLLESSLRKIRLKWLDEIKRASFGGIFKAERIIRKIAEYAKQQHNFKEEFRKKYNQRREELSKNQQQSQ